MGDRQSPTISGARVHYGVPTVWVEPYRTTTRHGDEVEVHEFYLNGSLIVVEGFKIRKSGHRYAKACALTAVTIPEEIIGVLKHLAKEDHA